MNPFKKSFDLPKLRTELEELLALVSRIAVEAPLKNNHDILCSAIPTSTVQPVETEADQSRDESRPIEPNQQEASRSDDTDPLCDDALVVITEFGHATAAMLQMWLAIDYGRAIKILGAFQAEGLISAKGRVRHKAFLRRKALTFSTTEE